MNRGLFSRIIEWKRVEKLISLLLVFPLPSPNVLLSKELVNDLERASLNIVMLMGFFLRSTTSKKNPEQRMNEKPFVQKRTPSNFFHSLQNGFFFL